jgi:uncharacterized metal-binding protein YceD (DUF177 family)
MTNTQTTSPPMATTHALSRVVNVHKLPQTGERIIFKPDEATCKALATELGLPGVDQLRAEILVVAKAGSIVQVLGNVTARIHQVCTVSLEDFASDISEEIEVRFAPPDRIEPIVAAEIERGLNDEDPPEPLVGDSIDVGALVIETLMLSLDPWPRKPGAAFAAHIEDDGKATHPFAGLAALKGKTESK